MDALPDELLDRVCSFLGRRELWKLVQVSSLFRRLGMLPYLAHFGISQADISSGTLSLSDSFFLILVVARINPIRRLVCFETVLPGVQLRYRRLGAILCVAAPIPDILIYNRQYMVQRTPRESAFLLSRIPSSATKTLLIVGGRTAHISRPRAAPPIEWVLLPPPLGSYNMSTMMKVLIVMFGIPLFFAYLVSGIINLGVVIVWAYDRFFGPPWSQEDRIIEDAGVIIFEHWMRIQSLPGKYTLVTLMDHRWRGLELRPRPGFTDAIYSTIITSLDYGTALQRFWVEQNTNLDYGEVLAFLRRHPELKDIGFTSGSIRASSLPVTAIPTPNPDNKITFLTTTSIYVPYFLPAAPNLCQIFIYPNRAARATSIGASLGYTLDLLAYHTALDALATLPGTHPIELHLSFRLPAALLPWFVLADLPPSEAAQLPETRLPRVHMLHLYCNNSERRFRALEIRDKLTPWLALFPSLQRLTFAYATVERIPAAERVVLAEGICAVCPGMTPSNVAFNVPED
ncbi:hypothetical protein C8R46DRAFT_1067530 [Mycena filopes]|nr:hypothetical protein C8R46DRAFT_1067530 [Mycena filopes]